MNADKKKRVFYLRSSAANNEMIHTKSESLFRRAQELIPGGVNSPVRAFRSVGGNPVFIARGFTGRDRIVKFEGCYHGHVDSLLVHAGSGALTHGQSDSAGVPERFAGLTIALPFNDIEAVREAFRKNP